jgi:general nucleoside transport system permease protein
MKAGVDRGDVSPTPSRLKALGLAAGAVVATVAAVAGLLGALRINPLTVYGLIILGAVGTPYNLSETFVQATPLILAGLGVALCFSARLWNIGAEGQLYVGAIAAVAIGLNIFRLPPPLVMPLALLAGLLAGAAWGFIPAILKLRFRAQEVLVTIMLNYVAIIVSGMVISGPWAQGTVPETKSIIPAAELPVVFAGTRFHVGVLIALASAVVVWGILYRTVVGYQIRAVGLNPDAAHLAGVRVGRVIIAAFCLSGGLAGLGGATLVLGIYHALVDGLSPGYGYTAIAVALLGNLHPLWTVLAAWLFAALYVGSQNMQIAAGVPVSLVLIIQSLLLLIILATRLVRIRGGNEQ